MREKARFLNEKETAERHVLPVMQEIVADWRERLIAVAEAGLTADVDSNTAANRFGAQNPLGYGY